MILAKEHRRGACLLFGTAFIAWLVAALWPTEHTSPAPPASPSHRTWEERKDSMRLADSLRYARWAEEREQRYDSFRLADSLRRAEWKRIRQMQYDSFRLADSLWRDSVGWRYTTHVKKDTVLDLNRCDTTELQFIRGIGPHTAAQIVRYRTQLGGFYHPGQLTDEALARYRLDTLLSHFMADPEDVQRLPVNRCSIERLQHHPYLRYKQAKAIYTLRRNNLRLKSMDDLRALPELTEEDLARIAPYLSFE